MYWNLIILVWVLERADRFIIQKEVEKILRNIQYDVLPFKERVFDFSKLSAGFGDCSIGNIDKTRTKLNIRKVVEEILIRTINSIDLILSD